MKSSGPQALPLAAGDSSQPGSVTENILNAITIDLEDWPQSCVDPQLPLSDRFVSNTRSVLDLLSQTRTRATFFVLGLAAEKAPSLIQELVREGHEVQSHGFGHRLIHSQSPDAFREDVVRAKYLLEDMIGKPVTAYRAPGFSITPRTIWALDILAEAGYRVDSSLFPIRTARYGFPGACRFPHRIRLESAELVECPVASLQGLGRLWPTGGGGYYRMWPYPVLRSTIRQINARAWPAVIYLHPYEFDLDGLHPPGVSVSWFRRIHQGLYRSFVRPRVERLLREFAFGRLDETLAAAPELPSWTYRPPHPRRIDEIAASPVPPTALVPS